MDQRIPPKFQQYDHHKVEKAFSIVQTMRVKKHIFNPSHRTIWTVVGYEGDQFVDPLQPYCSCNDFHYNVLGGKNPICYHLLSVQISQSIRKYEHVIFDDQEYAFFIKALINDITSKKKKHKG